jgi:hypothetical protein
MRLRTLTLVAIACGIVAAAVLVLVLPRTEQSAGAGGDPLAAAPAPTADPSRPALAQAWAQPPIGRGGMRIGGPARIVKRAADPAGGPAWAVRAFPARRTWRDRRGLVTQPPDRCVQLGRMLDGRFGWVDGRNVFRPVGLGPVGAPIQCRQRAGWTPWYSPAAERLTRIATPVDGPAQALQTVAWGFAGRSQHMELRVGGALEREARVEYRVPDPDGGTPWGLAATARPGTPACLSFLQRVAGRHVGSIDQRLGVLRPAQGYDGRPCSTSGPPRLTRRKPLAVYAAGDPGGQRDAGLTARRVVRRTLEGRTTVSGLAHPDVVSVTLVTPRDVRTITPSPREHAFAAVYDGVFATGGIEIRARMRDGSVHREQVGPFHP